MLSALKYKKIYSLVAALSGTLVFLICGFLSVFVSPGFILLVPLFLVVMLIYMGFLDKKRIFSFLLLLFVLCFVIVLLTLFIPSWDRCLFVGFQVILITVGGMGTGIFLCGRRSWWFFTLVCALLGVFFGISMESGPHGVYDSYPLILLITSI